MSLQILVSSSLHTCSEGWLCNLMQVLESFTYNSVMQNSGFVIFHRKRERIFRSYGKIYKRKVRFILFRFSINFNVTKVGTFKHTLFLYLNMYIAYFSSCQSIFSESICISQLLDIYFSFHKMIIHISFISIVKYSMIYCDNFFVL